MQIPVDPRTGMPAEVSFDWTGILPTALQQWLIRHKLQRIARQLRWLSEADLNQVGLSRLGEPRAT